MRILWHNCYKVVTINIPIHTCQFWNISIKCKRGEYFVLKIRLRKFFSFVLIVAFIASIFIFPQWYKKQVNKVRGMYFVAKGDKALRKVKFQKAIDYYLYGLRLYPEHYGAWLNLGNIYVAFEDYYSAVDAYENAIKHNPHYVMARMNYGIISAEKLGDFDGAINQYKEILGIRRKLVYIPFVFSNLRSYKTNMGLAYYNMGVAYRQKSIYAEHDYNFQQHYLREAIKAYEEAVKILKKDYDARYNLALAYQLNGDYNRAGLAYCNAIELAPMNYEAHYNLAILLRHLKKYKEAYSEMEKANTLIASKDGISNRQRYVFDVMNDVTKLVLMEEDGSQWLMEKFNEEMDASNAGMTYVNGKLVASDDLDKAMLKNFQTCTARTVFLDDEDED